MCTNGVLKRRIKMSNVGKVVVSTGAKLKSVSGLLVFGFLIYSLYFTGQHELTIFTGVLAFVILSIFSGLILMIPFGAALTPILFEWWWHDISFWDFTTVAWVVTAISLVPNVLFVAGIRLAQRED